MTGASMPKRAAKNAADWCEGSGGALSPGTRGAGLALTEALRGGPAVGTSRTLYSRPPRFRGSRPVGSQRRRMVYFPRAAPVPGVQGQQRSQYSALHPARALGVSPRIACEADIV